MATTLSPTTTESTGIESGLMAGIVIALLGTVTFGTLVFVCCFYKDTKKKTIKLLSESGQSAIVLAVEDWKRPSSSNTTNEEKNRDHEKKSNWQKPSLVFGNRNSPNYFSDSSLSDDKNNVSPDFDSTPTKKHLPLRKSSSSITQVFTIHRSDIKNDSRNTEGRTASDYIDIYNPPTDTPTVNNPRLPRLGSSFETTSTKKKPLHNYIDRDGVIPHSNNEQNTDPVLNNIPREQIDKDKLWRVHDSTAIDNENTIHRKNKRKKERKDSFVEVDEGRRKKQKSGAKFISTKQDKIMTVPNETETRETSTNIKQQIEIEDNLHSELDGKEIVREKRERKKNRRSKRKQDDSEKTESRQIENLLTVTDNSNQDDTNVKLDDEYISMAIKEKKHRKRKSKHRSKNNEYSGIQNQNLDNPMLTLQKVDT
ncbi:hypothetical protein ScPMuIL_012377 [Solemya velum]